MTGTVAAFELEVDLLHELTQGRVATYSDVTSFPAVLQDIAVIVPEDVPAARLAEVVRAGGGRPARRRSSVFDLYHGEQVGEGSKSLALRLEFRAPDRTLTDEEVAERRAAIETRARADRRAAPCLTASPSSAPPATAARSPPRSCGGTRRSS